MTQIYKLLLVTNWITDFSSNNHSRKHQSLIKISLFLVGEKIDLVLDKYFRFFKVLPVKAQKRCFKNINKLVNKKLLYKNRL